MDVNEERARWATESANVARGLSRLADLARLLDMDSEEVEIRELNDLAGRLHWWALRVAGEAGRPDLADDLARRRQAFIDWRKLEASVRSGPRQREA